MAAWFFAEKPFGIWIAANWTLLCAIVTEKMVLSLHKGMLKGRYSRVKAPEPVEGDGCSCLQAY